MNERFDLKKPQHLITVFLAVFILLTIPLTVISVLNQRDNRSQAANTTNMYILPAAQTVTVNTDFTVTVRENSGTTQVHAAEVQINYDTSKLTFVSADPNSSTDFKLGQSPDETSPGSGQIYFLSVVDPGTGSTPITLTGDKLLATLRFRTKAVAGAADIAFDPISNIEGVAGRETNNLIKGTVTVNDPLPNVNITSHTTNSYVKGSVTLAASATDNIAVTQVAFYDGATLIGTDTAPANGGGNNYTFTWNTSTASAGNHSITARASDANGVQTSTAVNLIVDNTLPSTPAVSGLTTKVQGSVTLTATSTDTNLQQIEFSVDGGTPTIDNTSPYSFPWNTAAVSSGTHTITATAVDRAGNISNPVFSQTVTVDNQGPTAFTVSGTAAGQTQINLTWTASTDALSAPVTYDVYRNGTKINPSPLPASTTTYQMTGLTAGTTYTFYVIARDSMPTPPNTTQTTNTASVATQAPFKAGDYNQDGKVNLSDLTLTINTWASTTDLRCDGNTSTKIDLGDLTVVINNWAP